MLEGRLAATIVGGFFRVFEIAFRLLQILVKAVRLPAERALARTVDPLISAAGKRWLAKRSRVNDDSIVFVAAEGEYGGNPKYIAEEILRRELPYRITWAMCDDSNGPFPREFRFVEQGTAAYFRALASAKVVVQNGRVLQNAGVHKNPSQYWVQTWHGTCGLGAFEGAGDYRSQDERRRALDTEQTDLVVTNSALEEETISRTDGSGVSKLRLGHARTDLLFDRSTETADALRTRVLQYLGIVDTGQKFLLYAPTYESGTRASALSGIDIAGLRATLSNRFGGEWEILIRAHHLHKRRAAAWVTGLPAYCRNASYYPDMQELLMVADAGLTDGSNWVFDYILTNKPAFLFSTNGSGVPRRRGVAHDLSDTPFTLSTTNAELLDRIAQFDQADYDADIEVFLQSSGSVDDGMAAARIVDHIEHLMS